MNKMTIALGVCLTALGLIAYLVLSSAPRSVTALIPAFFGVAFIVLGVVGGKAGARKIAMHLAALLALLGVMGTYRGVVQLPAVFRGDDVARPTAVVVQSIMAALCLLFVALCVHSFIRARRGGGASPD